MAQTPPQSRIRVAARLANGFALDLVKVGGFGRDAMDGLLLAAIGQANLAHVTRNPELQRAYATLDQPPPDDLRRPASISGIANSLRIPFETARRRITALVEQDIVRTTTRGVIVPQASSSSPLYRRAAVTNYDLVRTLYFRLRAIGVLDDLAQPVGPAFDPDRPPMGMVMRMSSDYLLRLAEPLNVFMGDLVTALVLMDTIHANTEHLADTDGGTDTQGWDPVGFIADEQRRPVRAAALSERLGIPPETVRRHLVRLIEAQQCERTGFGYVVPSRFLVENGYVRHMMDNQSHLHRLFHGLADFGLLAEWERERLGLKGAA